MKSQISVDFGWLPERFDQTVGCITVATLADFDDSVKAVTENGGVEGDWIYAPPSRYDVLDRGTRTAPYPARVFGLPKTHRLRHTSADGRPHLEFLLWALSFSFGLRLTATEAGFLDATPIRTGSLNDFVLSLNEQKRALALAEKFWHSNARSPLRAKRWGAAVHALFLGQCPLLLQFERFIYFYGALDTCYRLTKDVACPTQRDHPHGRRIAWMCQHFGMPVPSWGDDNCGRPSPLADIRNSTLHESLFMDAPLGFALHGVGTGENLTLEMEALTCRFLVALLGDPKSDYVRSSIETRQFHGWTPPAYGEQQPAKG